MNPMDGWVAGLISLVGLIGVLRLAQVTWMPGLAERVGTGLRRWMEPTPEREALLRMHHQLQHQREQLRVARSRLELEQNAVAIREEQLRAQRKALSESRSQWDAMTRRLRLARRINRTRRRQADELTEAARREMQRSRDQYASWQGEIGEVRVDLDARRAEIEQAEQRLQIERDRFDAERQGWYDRMQVEQGDLAGEREKIEAQIREFASFRLRLHDDSPDELPTLLKAARGAVTLDPQQVDLPSGTPHRG